MLYYAIFGKLKTFIADLSRSQFSEQNGILCQFCIMLKTCFRRTTCPGYLDCGVSNLFYCAKWYLCLIWWPFGMLCFRLTCLHAIDWSSQISVLLTCCSAHTIYLTAMKWNGRNSMLGTGICRSSKDLSRPNVACYWSLWRAVHELLYSDSNTCSLVS